MKKLVLSIATVVSLGLFVGCTDTIVSDQISNNSDTLSLDEGTQSKSRGWFDDWIVDYSIDWEKQDGLALDVGIGNYTAWRVARSGVYQYVGSGESNGWMKTQTGSGKRIDVDGNGIPWIIDLNNQIYKYNGNTWDNIPGNARDIGVGVGAEGNVWMIHTTMISSNGYKIKRLNESGTGWDRISGAAVRIDVDSEGNAWIVDAQGTIYHYNGTSWDLVPGPKAIDIAVANGSVGIIEYSGLGVGGKPWSYNIQSGKWTEFNGTLNNIAKDDHGSSWGTNGYGHVYASSRSHVFGYWR